MHLRHSRWATMLIVIAACARGGDAGASNAAARDSAPATGTDTPITTMASDTGTAVATVAEDSGDPDGDVHRPVEIDLTIASKNDRNGTYNASGTSRICGRQRVSGFPMPKSFGVQFPFDGEHRIVDLVFTAPELATGGSTEKFWVNAEVINARGGKPSGFVLRAGERNETGTATLSDEHGTWRIVAEGRNAQNEVMTLTIVCRPRAK